MRTFIAIAATGALALAGTTGIALAQAAAGVDDEAAEQQGRGGRPAPPPPVTLESRPDASGGEALYIDKCIMCHGPSGMGTGLLGRTRDVAMLEARGDLKAPFVIVAARQGIGNMPAIPRGEVSDEKLKAIADYLAAGPHEVTP